MSKKKAYVDRNTPFALTNIPSFYAYEVMVDEQVLKWIDDLNKLASDIQYERSVSAFPTDAQRIADLVTKRLGELMKVRRRKNVKLNNEE